jgi:uncharacterized protein YchJ
MNELLNNINKYLNNVGIDATKITKEHMDMLSNIDFNNIDEIKTNEILNILKLDKNSNYKSTENNKQEEYKRIKRNEMCICGSYKKYKKCCLK